MGRLEYTDDVIADLVALDPTVDTVSLGVALRLLWTGRLFEDILDRTANAAGVRWRGDYEVLSVLMRMAAHPPTPAGIADQLSSSPSGMTNRLDRLENGGMITRNPDPDDRRLVRISLTEDGRRVAVKAFDLSRAVYGNLVEGLSAEDRDALDSYLRAVLKRLDELGSMRTPWGQT